MGSFWPKVGSVVTLDCPTLAKYHGLAARVVSMPIWRHDTADNKLLYRVVMVLTENNDPMWARIFHIKHLAPPAVKNEKGDWSTCCWEPDTRSLSYLRAEMRLRRRGKKT